MKKYTLLLFFIPLYLVAQNHTLTVEYAQTTTQKFLLLSSEKIKEEKYINHQLVDLVDAVTVDSTFTRKFERHRVIGGGIIRLAGYQWRAFDFERQKYVGWVNHVYLRGENGDAQFTEWDVNYDLIAVLPQYVNKVYSMYQKTLDYKKRKNNPKQGAPPFVYPNKETDMTKYRLHCENTPPVDLRAELNAKAYPIHNVTPPASHPNMMDEHPIMGMYGILCLDCNHTCGPEMHPYEWLWWLNLTKETPSWNFALVRDVSNRFKHWSTSPRTGIIKIPFSFPIHANEYILEINHQVFSAFNPESFKQLPLPKEIFHFKALETDFNFNLPELANKVLKVKSNISMPYESLAYYINELKLDETNQIVTGYLNIAVSVSDAYAGDVKMKYFQLQIKN